MITRGMGRLTNEGRRRTVATWSRRRLGLALAGGVAVGAVARPRDAAALVGLDIVRAARDYLGGVYKKGGNGPHAFDCSGLTWRAVKDATGGRVDISRDLKRQSRKAGRKVSLGAKQQGDLIFFKSGSKLVHVGIYVGGGNLLSAMNPKDDIDIVPINRLGGQAFKARRIE